jgi:N-acetylmuramoyl-L-alanine amidase
VRELHQLLGAVGLTSSDAADVFDAGTVAMVESFQRSRGLPLTGVVDATTWSRLREAGWRLGQRLLYLTSPNLRGDDVAELQTRLAQLGFNPGRIDGIFGPLLEGALADFQRNCGAEPSGTLTRATLVDLLRLSAVVAGRHLVTEARDQAGFDEDATGPVVLCGQGELLGFVARALTGALDVHVLETTTPEQSAAAANALGAGLVLSFQSVDQLNGVHLHYWASYRSHSHRGDRLAGEIATALARTGTLPRVEVTGMALPILRETRMTTLQVEHGTPATPVLAAIADEMAGVITGVFHRFT